MDSDHGSFNHFLVKKLGVLFKGTVSYLNKWLLTKSVKTYTLLVKFRSISWSCLRECSWIIRDGYLINLMKGKLSKKLKKLCSHFRTKEPAPRDILFILIQVNQRLPFPWILWYGLSSKQFLSLPKYINIHHKNFSLVH